MTTDNQELGQSQSQELGQGSTGAVDFAFLVAQTFADEVLEREVLELFVAQAHRILGHLPEWAPRDQADAAHLLKGSARGIGAWHAADAAERYEAAVPNARAELFPALAAAFAAAEAAISARLASLRT